MEHLLNEFVLHRENTALNSWVSPIHCFRQLSSESDFSFKQVSRVQLKQTQNGVLTLSFLKCDVDLKKINS